LLNITLNILNLIWFWKMIGALRKRFNANAESMKKEQ